METFSCDYLIIGGGPCGLGAALRLDREGQDWALLEAEDHFGGLSASRVDAQGFTWDLGGHVLFSHYQTFDDYMALALGDAWCHHQRESWIWIKNRFVPYPFQYNLHRLDPEDRWACVKGLLEAVRKGPGATPPAHFEAWMRTTMGEGITDLFMRPYNFKVWAWPPAEMSYGWIGERVAIPPLEQVMHSICTGQDNASWGPNNMFRFPLNGGTGAIWKALGNRLPAGRCFHKARVVRVDAARRIVEDEQGRAWSYKRLISTMPLDQLIRIAPGVVPGTAAERFRHSATHLVGIGMEGRPPEHLQTKCWMYFPQDNSPYYRTTVFSNYSPNNTARPGEQWSLMTEVSESPARPVAAGRIVADVLRAFREDGLMTGSERIVTQTHFPIPYAYPTPFLDRDAVVDPVLRRFEEQDIFSRGRFGAWKYESGNMDHCMAQGYECAERLVRDAGPEAEPTLFTPHIVNNRRNP